MMKLKQGFSIFVFFIILCSLCIVISRLTWAKCINGIYVDSSSCPPKRDVHSIDLLVDEAIFPVGWRSISGSNDDEAPMFGLRVTQEGAFIGFAPIQHTTPGTGASQHVDRYFTIGQAESYYRLEKEKETRTLLAFTEWEHNPNSIPFMSEIVDEFHVACTHDHINMISKCIFIARYDEYVVRFRVTAISDIWASEDFNFAQMLEAIDKKIKAKLY